MPEVTVFVCGERPVDHGVCSCGERAVGRCAFALRGRKHGTSCDRPLCARCGVRVGEADICIVGGGAGGGKTQPAPKAYQVALAKLPAADRERLIAGRFSIQCPPHARMSGAEGVVG